MELERSFAWSFISRSSGNFTATKRRKFTQGVLRKISMPSTPFSRKAANFSEASERSRGHAFPRPVHLDVVIDVAVGVQDELHDRPVRKPQPEEPLQGEEGLFPCEAQWAASQRKPLVPSAL
jgi:hypothetical protein